MALPKLFFHVTFSDPIDISFEAVAEMRVLSPKKARDEFFTSLVSKLNTTIKAKWEASGQGTGGRLEGESDESENGMNVVDYDEFGGAQAKSEFLNGYSQEVVLYLWEQFSANFNVLTSILQRISGSCALNGSRCGPNSLKTKSEKKQKLVEEDEKEMKLLQDMGSTAMKETKEEALFMFNVEGMKKRILLDLNKEKIFLDAEDRRDDAGVHGARG